MARTNVSKKQIKAPYNDANLTALHTKFAEHDTALDSLEAFTGGTTDYKASCRFATTANLTLASAGTSAVDGVTPVAGNRVLVKDQSTPSQNGIYIVGATAWTRATDFDASAEATSGARVFVSEGTANGGKWFSLTTADPITLGSTSLTWTQEPNAAELASNAASKGASLVGVQDANALVEGATVEAAIANIATGNGLTAQAPVRRVRAVATTNIGTLSAVSTSFDGLTLVAGDRVLLTAQSTGAEEGIYVVGTVVAGPVAPWTRATDWAAAAAIPAGTMVVVDAGTSGANTIWKITNAGGVTVDSTNPTWERLYTSTELASTAASKGASLIGLQDASSLVASATVEAAISTDIAKGNGLTALAPTRRVRAASTANLAAFTGVSTTLDGLTLVEGDRVLVKDQTSHAEDGIYVVGVVGGGTADWTRAADWAAGAVVPNGTLIIVDAGTVGANTIYKSTNAGAITVNTTVMTWQRVPTTTELASTASGKGASLIGIYDTPDKFTATTVEAALAEVKTLADAAIGAVKRTVTVDEADLSGASQTVAVGAALPANAVVFAHEIIVNEQGVLAGNDLAIKIGGTDDDAIVASTDLDALNVGSYSGTLGAHPQGFFGSQTINAIFTASDLATLSAGNWTINVWYFVLA